jgi:hypothetical protein
MATFVFDIDGTICSYTDGNYDLAQPIKERIKLINKLYDSGNQVIFYTARGMGTFKNNSLAASQKWQALTEIQLNEWGVNFHALFFGKPAGDFYIDDKAINDLEFFTLQY